jgi:hypothetical protein
MLRYFQPKIKKPGYSQSMRENPERLPSNMKEAERLLVSERES